MSETVELLSHDDEGNAIEGPKYPLDSSAVIYDPGDIYDGRKPPRLAYPRKFFKYDDRGRPMPDTIVKFLVPDYLHDGPSPSRHACDLVAQRMGWMPDIGGNEGGKHGS